MSLAQLMKPLLESNKCPSWVNGKSIIVKLAKLKLDGYYLWSTSWYRGAFFFVSFRLVGHSISFTPLHHLFSFMHHASTNYLLLRFYCHVLSPKKPYNTQYSLPPDVASKSPHPRALRTRRFNSDLASKEGCLGSYGTKISKHKYFSNTWVTPLEQNP